MRILWVAPWFRTLAVAWANGLRARGHDVVVATTDQHFDAPELAPDDIVLRRPWRTAVGLAEFREARSYVSRFGPDVVVTEQVRDPRFLALALNRAPVALTIHDAMPHDSANATPLMRRANGRILDRVSRLDVVFSSHVAHALSPRPHPVVEVPLTSEMPETLTPPLVAASGRHDFLVVGRLSKYKNVGMILEAFERHRSGPGYRGDRLVLIGGGDPGVLLPQHVEWVDGRFRFADVAPRIASAKATLCMYSAGSQSGVQVLSMQCGTACLVSDVGGLKEYLPEGEAALASADSLHAAIEAMADPESAERRGQEARRTYERRFSVSVTSQAWEESLEALAGVR